MHHLTVPDWIEKLKTSRQGKRIGREILFFPEVDSTNRQAFLRAREGAGEGLLLLADRQSQGKGRRGRVWESPAGVNLYASMILRPPIPPAIAPQITLLAGVAGARALARASGLEARIKWPNDIHIRGKKVGGILSEMKADGTEIQFIVLGMGINVNWPAQQMPPELQEVATSLLAEAGKDFDRAVVAGEILEEVEREYTLFLQEGFSPGLREEWNRLSGINGKWATVTMMEGRFEGKVLGIDADGALLLLTREGEIQRFIAGDVSLRV